ncbi:hypothetical protein BDK51DRAFT_49692 [Blyttiomyces helicus]|uniref:Cyclin-domain-containing protein n=1 Tax=Blyttiomyces helicus TaxID=388810 RepID=A0A4V1IQZ5_9FUNG|nr:hypothetical protein BDK51DRAFT_49692 [Blyttiomyces helicus]|eukprot:RKO88277.1 hypothetical protein BDK51DRAFT_49692 [Blyttiomyces helicus]
MCLPPAQILLPPAASGACRPHPSRYIPPAFSPPLPPRVECILPRPPPPSHHSLLVSHFDAILSRTRTSLPVVMLALHFTHRLRLALVGAPSATTSLCIVRRSLLIALVLADKVLNDDQLSNAAWAKVAGVSVGEVNRLERRALGLLDFDLFLSEGQYARWLRTVERVAGVVGVAADVGREDGGGEKSACVALDGLAPVLVAMA